MAAPKIGSTTDDLTSVGRRDAFHFPGVLVTSDHALEPKQDVRFTDSSCTKVEPAHENERMAVVDPFVTAAHIPTGLAFWVFLAPGFVDNLVHHFEIRDFQSNDVTVKTSSDVRRLEEEAQNDKKLSADRALQSQLDNATQRVATLITTVEAIEDHLGITSNECDGCG